MSTRTSVFWRTSTPRCVRHRAGRSRGGAASAGVVRRRAGRRRGYARRSRSRAPLLSARDRARGPRARCDRRRSRPPAATRSLEHVLEHAGRRARRTARSRASSRGIPPTSAGPDGSASSSPTSTRPSFELRGDEPRRSRRATPRRARRPRARVAGRQPTAAVSAARGSPAWPASRQHQRRALVACVG